MGEKKNKTVKAGLSSSLPPQKTNEKISNVVECHCQTSPLNMYENQSTSFPFGYKCQKEAS